MDGISIICDYPTVTTLWAKKNRRNSANIVINAIEFLIPNIESLSQSTYLMKIKDNDQARQVYITKWFGDDDDDGY
jgi:hypothetical protein